MINCRTTDNKDFTVRRRSSFVTVLDNTSKSSLSFILLVMLNIFYDNGIDLTVIKKIYTLIPIAIIASIFAIVFFIQFIIWRITYFNYDGESVTLERNGLIKKRLTIPIEKVSTIDVKKNILGHLTGTSRVKIDSGNVAKGKDDDNAEINLIFNDKFAYEIRNLILNKKETDENKNKFVMKLSDFIIEGLLQRKLIYLATFLFSIYLLVTGLFGDKVAQNLSAFAKALYSLPVLLIILIVFLIIVGTNVVSVILEILKYYNFTLYKQNDALVTDFGFFLKQTYTLPIDKIKSVILMQNMLFRVFGYYSITVVCTGFGDERKEKSVLFPFADKHKVKQILSLVNTNIAEEKVYNKVQKQGKPFYFIFPTLFLSIAITAALLLSYMANPLYSIPIMLMALFIYLLSYLKLVNVGLFYNKNIISTTSGIFTKIETIVFMNQVQEIVKKEAFYKRSRSVCNIRISYYLGIKNPCISNIDKTHFANLTKLLEQDTP